MHTLPLIAVPYTRKSRTGLCCGTTLVSLMTDAPDSYSEAIGLHEMCHN